MNKFAAIAAFMILATASLITSGCQAFSPIANPAEVNCTEAEATPCRLVIATYLIDVANNTIRDQFNKGNLPQAEAVKARAIVAKAEAALVQANAAAKLAAADTDTKLAALETLLNDLLAQQLIKLGS